MKKLALYVGNLNTKIALANAGIREEREPGDQLIEILGIVVIAIVILFIFRQQLIDLFNTAMNTVKDKITTQLFNDAGTTYTGTP